MKVCKFALTFVFQKENSQLCSITLNWLGIGPYFKAQNFIRYLLQFQKTEVTNKFRATENFYQFVAASNGKALTLFLPPENI